VLDLFRSHCAQYARTTLPDHLRSLVAHLSRLLPDLALLFPELTTAPLLPALNPEEEKRRLFAAMTLFLTERAALQPILFVVEDVQWSDDLSLDFLLHLIRRCRDVPILVLATYRSDALHARMRLWLAQLDRERLTQEFLLAPLSRGEVGAMARAILGQEQAVDARLVTLLYTLSDGNPFFVEELLKSLVATGELQCIAGRWVSRTRRRGAGESPPVPRSVRAVVQQRTDQLSAAAWQVLTLAAVAGRRFDFALLQRALRCDEGQLLSHIKELIAAQLVIEESADRFAFRHALLREAVYGRLLVRERRALHRTLADNLEQLSSTSALRERYLGDLAAHCYEAGMWERVMRYEQQLGERALALYAQRAAIGHFTRVVAAAHQLSVTPPGDVYLARGHAYSARGRFARARRDYERALDLAHTASDGSLEWQCMLALGFLWAARDYAQAGVWLRRALAQAQSLSDPTLQARSLNRLGNWLGNTGHIEEGLHAHQAALSIFEEQQHTKGMAETLDLLGTAYGMHGDRVRAVELLGQAVTLFFAQNDTPCLLSSLAMRAIQSMPAASETTYSPLRSRAACVHDATESLRLARQIGALTGQAYAENTLAHTFLSFGDFGLALAHAYKAQRLASEIEHQQWMVATACGVAQIYILLLAPALAMAALEAAVLPAQDLGSSFWLARLAVLQARIGLLNRDLPAVEATLCTVMPRTQQPRTVAERDIALVWGELMLAQGEPETALHVAEHLLASAPGGQAPGQGAIQPAQPIPHLLKVKGEALLALARLDDAMVALEDARRGAQERGARPVLWTIHRSLGDVHQRRRRFDDARRERAAARRLVEELAAAVAEKTLRDQFLDAALSSLPRDRPLRARAAAKQAFGGLTAREREVAALITQGKTSREIAEMLVISERTAEAHVGNILGKLRFTSRAQIAAWGVETGLVAR
jgi:DNA-binding CsgD family transcriptional regulator